MAAPATADSRITDPSERRFCALVTRPREDAAGLVAALAARGVATVVEPLLDIAYRGGPAPDLFGVQAILCTSANGVRALVRLVTERDLPLFAVGAASAAAADDAGFARVASADGNVEDLAALVAERLSPDAGRLLQVAGSAVAGDLAGDLRERGFTVERAVLYDARPATALGRTTVAAFDAGAIDAALFFSPRTAAIFARLAAAVDLAPAMRRVTAISISAAANAALAPLPFRDRRIALRPDQPSLLAALDRLVAVGCAT